MIKSISKAKSLRGEIIVPGDKSISHRAVMLGGISNGTTEITGFLEAADPLSTLSCYRAMGIESKVENGKLFIFGKGIHGLQKPSSVLDAGNSGTTMRLLSGILAGQKFPTSISGDQYLNKRPMKRIIDPLTKMGAKIASTEKYTAPLNISPVEKLRAIEYELPVASAQVKSAVLLAGLYADGVTKVIESKQSRDHTERMLNLSTEEINGKNIVSVTGGMKLTAKEFIIPGDPSSAAFFVVAGLISKSSEIIIRNVGLNPTRTGFLNVLRQMGGRIRIENERVVAGEPIGDLIVTSSELKSNLILQGDIIPNIIDEIPILSIAAAHAIGSFEVRGAKDLRNKETDRIVAVCKNLRAMGLTVDEFEDGFAFDSKNKLFNNNFESFDDHRIAMAFGIASLALEGESKITNAECVNISYPNFWDTLQILQH
ncbi:MAG: 3-phosphoshikimate 1-carboxyvinyltransferase [Bacteroidota bacterium]|nr:3-phosphoshikimate 1-carboxyvinyltransferase [Bacteroidota bacterium]